MSACEERTATPSHAFRAMKSLLLLQFPVTHRPQIVVCIPLTVIPNVARNLLFSYSIRHRSRPHIFVATLRDWEQGRATPDQPTQA